MEIRGLFVGIYVQKTTAMMDFIKTQVAVNWRTKLSTLH